MTNNTASKPVIPAGPDIEAQARTLFHDSLIWIESHWLNIAIAAGVAVLIVGALHAVRAWAMRLCQRGSGTATWYSVVGRALSRTGNFFIIMTALRLVAGYASPPQVVASTIGFLFTIAAVFQVAIWVRELIFGAIEHRTTSENYTGEGLASAIGIIRLLVSIVLFAIATVMVLSNVGVNVTGLVAGLGIGGIAIALAVQNILGDLLGALSIVLDKPFVVGDFIAVGDVLVPARHAELAPGVAARDALAGEPRRERATLAGAAGVRAPPSRPHPGGPGGGAFPERAAGGYDRPLARRPAARRYGRGGGPQPAPYRARWPRPDLLLQLLLGRYHVPAHADF